jgi:formylglycine-generating enzyme required for sulfatase activity
LLLLSENNEILMKKNLMFYLIGIALLLAPCTSRAQLEDAPSGSSSKPKPPAPKAEPVAPGKQAPPVAKPRPTTPPAPKPKRPATAPLVEPEMVAVQGGSFKMGNADGLKNEKDVHDVTVGSFQMSKKEVTQKLWLAVMGNYPSEHDACDDCPVERVSWNDVQTFIAKLNEKTKKQYRLPTEAEWEYAARGGSNHSDTKYSGSNSADEVGWTKENGGGTTHPCAQKKPNALGIYDMTGNVWEWCSDFYDGSYYKSSPPTDPKGPVSGSYKVFRGGGFDQDATTAGCTYRNASAPDVPMAHVGFRLCR